jgi:hypothetical protein
MPVALLDHAVEGYLAFRKDTGDRLKATLVAEPNSVRGQCLRGYLMMLFGQRAMVSRAQRPLDAAQAAARSVCVTPREAAHVAALAAWVAGDFGGATACWESIAADHPRDVLALKLAQYAGSILEIANGCATCWGAPSPPGTQVCRATVLFSAAYAFALEDTGDYGAAGARRAGGGRAQTRQTFEPPTPSRMSWR